MLGGFWRGKRLESPNWMVRMVLSLGQRCSMEGRK